MINFSLAPKVLETDSSSQLPSALQSRLKLLPLGVPVPDPPELLVSCKLTACVQIANIASCYMWKGRVNKESEYLLLIKTATHLYHEVEATIVENHSHEIPKVIQFAIAQGLDCYLGWIGENTKQEQVAGPSISH